MEASPDAKASAMSSYQEQAPVLADMRLPWRDAFGSRSGSNGWIEHFVVTDDGALAVAEGFCPVDLIPLAGDCLNWCLCCRTYWQLASVPVQHLTTNKHAPSMGAARKPSSWKGAQK